MSKPHGHFCRICRKYKANEKFSGRGHAAHSFPCISTGVYGYPFREACVIALRTIEDFLQTNEGITNEGITQVYMVCYGDSDYARFETILKDYM